MERQKEFHKKYLNLSFEDVRKSTYESLMGSEFQFLGERHTFLN